MENMEMRDKIEALEISAEKILAIFFELMSGYFGSDRQTLISSYPQWKVLIDIALDYVKALHSDLVKMDREMKTG